MLGMIIIVALILICLVVFYKYITMDAAIKNIIIGAVLLILILLLLSQLGAFDSMSWPHWGRR